MLFLLLIPLGLLTMLFYDKAEYLPSQTNQLMTSNEIDIISKYKLYEKRYNNILASINSLTNELTKLQFEYDTLSKKLDFIN